MNGSAGIEERGGGASSSLRAALAAATDRLQAVVDDAETAAANIVEEAEARAKRILEETEAESRQRVQAADREAHDFVAERLGATLELVGEVVQRAEAVGRDAELLRGAASRLQAAITSLDADEVAQAQGAAPPAGMPDSTAPSSASTGSGAAQLRAVQMAVGGLSDEQIERRLRREFGSEDVGRALDVLRRLESRS